MVKRRLRGDMLEVFKILNGIDKIDREHFFVYSRSTLRGHNQKLFKPRGRLDIKKNSFFNLVIHPWNSLPQDVIYSCNVSTFKNRLDKCLIA